MLEVSLDTTHAIEAICKLNVDVLVFADVLSEPMNHFLAHSRLAKTQVYSLLSLSTTWPNRKS